MNSYTLSQAARRLRVTRFRLKRLLRRLELIDKNGFTRRAAAKNIITGENRLTESGIGYLSYYLRR